MVTRKDRIVRFVSFMTTRLKGNGRGLVKAPELLGKDMVASHGTFNGANTGTVDARVLAGVRRFRDDQTGRVPTVAVTEK
jgi:hypothetical protein